MTRMESEPELHSWARKRSQDRWPRPLSWLGLLVGGLAIGVMVRRRAPSSATLGDGVLEEPGRKPVDASTQRPSTAGEAFLARIEAIIDEELHNRDFSVADLAGRMFMSRTHVYRKARQLVGKSPSELIRERRLERARQLLAGGGLTVSEVAYRVGYSSPPHFSRAFRNHFGQPPSQILARVS